MLSKTLIELCLLTDHDEDTQAVILISVLKDFRIVKKIDYYIEDNHDFNDKLCQTISLFLQEEEMKWDFTHH